MRYILIAVIILIGTYSFFSDAMDPESRGCMLCIDDTP